MKYHSQNEMTYAQMQIGLPYILTIIAECAGNDAAMKLAFHYGGRRMFIPLTHEKWAVSKVIGIKAAQVLIHERSGEMLDIPTCSQPLASWLRLHGWSVDDVAHRLHTPRRTILKWSKTKKNG